MNIEQTFFELLQIALGNREALSGVPSPEEWKEVLELANSQAVTGVAYSGVERLNEEQAPTANCVEQWTAFTEFLTRQNIKVSAECVEALEILKKTGFHSCLLKGQALLSYYPDELKLRRYPGDVDVWVKPNDYQIARWAHLKRSWVERWMMIEHSGITVLFSRRVSKKNLDVCYHHVHCDMLPNNEVELHFTPCYLINPWKNWRLQRLLDREWNHVEEQASGIRTLPLGMNVVFLIAHFYRHLILEGVGLKQLIDVYFVIKALVDEDAAQTLSGELNSKEKVVREVRKLGMTRITRAMMWVMKEVLGMDEKYMLLDPSEKYGKHLLGEILKGGNMGTENETVGKIHHSKSRYVRFLNALKFNMRLLRTYPREVLWIPPHSIAQSVLKNYWRRHPSV